jgi:hypothetical protein
VTTVVTVPTCRHALTLYQAQANRSRAFAGKHES